MTFYAPLSFKIAEVIYMHMSILIACSADLSIFFLYPRDPASFQKNNHTVILFSDKIGYTFCAILKSYFVHFTGTFYSFEAIKKFHAQLS